MKKFLFIFVLLFTTFAYKLNAENYAIYIAGNMPVWTESLGLKNTEYWNDLFLMYEYLIDSARYNHNNVIVFFGRGADWQTQHTLDRYNISIMHPEWANQPGWSGHITDFDSRKSTIVSQINAFTNILTPNDNILIIWREFGYGGSETDDYTTKVWDYFQCDSITDQNLESYNEILVTNSPACASIDTFDEETTNPTLENLFKFENGQGNKLYKRRKILWFTCHSGALIKGIYNFNNNNSIAITCGDYNNTCWDIQKGDCTNPIIVHNWSSQFVPWATLNDGDPFICGNNNDLFSYSSETHREYYRDDNIISLGELYDEYTRNPIIINHFNPSYPQIGDDSHRAYYEYIAEDLKLIPKGGSDMLLNKPTFYDDQEKSFRGYWVDKITASGDGGNKVIVPNNSDVRFAVSEQVDLKSGFECHSNTRFHAYIGDIEPNTVYQSPQINNDDQRKFSKNFINKDDINFIVFPNPMNEKLNIRYNIFEKSRVLISINNLLCSNYIELVNENEHPTGAFNKSFDINNLLPGVYLCSINYLNYSLTKKFYIIK